MSCNGGIPKQQSHGRIGEAATAAKCWMNGIRAYSTAGLRPNFPGSDLLVETGDRNTKLWLQVKTGYPIKKNHVYLTQAADDDLTKEKFVSEFVIFVNLEPEPAKAHQHDGALGLEHLSFFVVPREEANRLYRQSLQEEYQTPKRDGSQRKLGGIAVHVPTELMQPYREAWQLIRSRAMAAGMCVAPCSRP